MQFFIILTLVIRLSKQVQVPTPEDYVSQYCAGVECRAQRVICQRKGHCAPRPNCGYIAPTRAFRRMCMDVHNQLRHAMALGREGRFGNSHARSMNAVSYDNEIEFMAACHANQCLFEHDACRGTAKYPSLGQNMARWLNSKTPDLDIAAVKKLIYTWYVVEIQLGNARIIDELPNAIQQYGHFTQMMWEDVEALGCARSYLNQSDGTYMLFLFCNYSTGNVTGRPVYRRGPPCSECPRGRVSNREFPALCGYAHMDRTDNKYYFYAPNRSDPVFVSTASITAVDFNLLIISVILFLFILHFYS